MNFDETKIKVINFLNNTKGKITDLSSKINYEKIKNKYNELNIKVKEFIKNIKI